MFKTILQTVNQMHKLGVIHLGTDLDSALLFDKISLDGNHQMVLVLDHPKKI